MWMFCIPLKRQLMAEIEGDGREQYTNREGLEQGGFLDKVREACSPWATNLFQARRDEDGQGLWPCRR